MAPLARKAFIPVKDGEKTRLARLDEVYLVSKVEVGSLYSNAFTFVDFGPRANLFLTQCGVRSEPSHKGTLWNCMVANLRHCPSPPS